VLAVLTGLAKGRAGTVRGDALAAESNGDFIGLRIGALDAPLSHRIVDAHAFDDLALLVVEAPEESTRSEQAPQATVRESR
jgi:hypothetical protein